MATEPDQPYNLTRYYRYVWVPLFILCFFWCIYIFLTVPDIQSIPFFPTQAYNWMPEPSAPPAAQ